MSIPAVWRLHIKQEDHVEVDDRCLLCVREKVAGMGWSVPCDNALLWDEYCGQSRTKYGEVNDNVTRLKNEVKAGDLVWSRSQHGKYFLGQILGEWEYRNSEDHQSADIHNVRSCAWVEVGDLSEVPGTIRNAFIRGQTLRRIVDQTMMWFSMDLFNRCSSSPQYELPSLAPDLLSLLDPDACEDVVGIYLQSQGWLLYPSTCKTETQNYEFTLRHSVSGAMAAVQVKQGNQPLVIDQYECFQGHLFLFQTNGNYVGGPKKSSTTLLDTKEIARFCFDHAEWMPTPIQRWIEWVKSSSAKPELG